MIECGGYLQYSDIPVKPEIEIKLLKTGNTVFIFCTPCISLNKFM